MVCNISYSQTALYFSVALMTLEEAKSRVKIMRAYSREMAKKKRHTLRTIFVGILVVVAMVVLAFIIPAALDWLDFV
jgi:hypothetical protein